MLIRIATRASAQALAQTGWVAEELRRAHPGLEVVLVETQTQGDADKTTPIALLGGKGVFAKEVSLAVLDGRADLAVHSGKDLPSVTADGLVIAAVPARRDPRDVLVGSSLADLPPGARVATGSARRRAQLAWLRPDLTFAELRGNIPTRLERAAHHDAIVMAAAALVWLGLEDRATEVLEPDVMLPQVAQGSLAIEARARDGAVIDLLAGLEDPVNRRCFDAERAFLATLGGDCNLPAGAFAVPALADPDTDVGAEFVSLTGLLASPDGHIVLRRSATGCEPDQVGAQVATELLDLGGRQLLEG